MVAEKKYLTPDEEVALIRQAQAGNINSRNYLIERNYGYLMSEATRFSRLYERYRKEDVLGQITLAYMHAITKFDCSRGLRLSTFATFCIRNQMRRFLATDNLLIRVPAPALSGEGAQGVQDAVQRVKNGFRSIHVVDGNDSGDGHHPPDRLMDRIPERESEIEEFNRQQFLAEECRKQLPRRTQKVLEMRISGRSFRLIGKKIHVTKQRAGQIYLDAVTRIQQMLREQGQLPESSQGVTNAHPVPDGSSSADSTESH